MNRLLLTMLALLTGLLAPVASANASIGSEGAAQVSAVQAARVAARAAARSMVVAVRGRVETHHLSGMRSRPPYPAAANVPQAVLIGIDRARE